MADKKYFSDDNFAYFWQKLKEILKDKVDKVDGKGLSTNDFTNDDQAKVTNSHNYIENTLKTWITEIEALIPEEATSSNQLADKDFVNSSIATNTAVFRGTYETIDALPTKTDSNDLRENDYAFVVITDSNGNPEYQRYKYTTAEGWTFEYILNNSSFTAEQWASIQSGITSALVSQITTNKNNISSLDGNKANKVDLGDLAYKDGLSKSEVGLGNVDNTSDANKPISTATQAALNQKASASDVTALTTTVSNHAQELTRLNNVKLNALEDQDVFGTLSFKQGIRLGSIAGGAASENPLPIGGGRLNNPDLDTVDDVGIYYCDGGTHLPGWGSLSKGYTLMVFESAETDTSGTSHPYITQFAINKSLCWVRKKLTSSTTWDNWESFGETTEVEDLTTAEIEAIFNS